ncbi:hypothetical protein DFH08DRAFT_806951 [Mycena albidolilacea]|uniref:DUF6589 domain-containing protein n=1 Tax=Mycena albidolilacea TaxID=1033008 RepID=A0AAD7ETD2_9AGAR|nr:hypothetical protein DFH08DRAFT_806951 [Mycena albidolilacea]
MAGLSQFSLHTLITTLFTSDHSKITNVTNSYLGREGGIHLLETAFGDQALQNPNIRTWIMEKAAIICSQEASSLTDRAFGGRHYEDALYLRAPTHSLTVQRLKSFSVPQLLIIYECTTPRLQTFIKAVIGKNPTQTASRSARNPNMVHTMITSMVLNARSRESNLHAAMNSLFLWNGQVSKRVVETLNHYAFCNSPRYQAEAIQIISKDSLHLARTIANDPERLIMLPNDNFNWVGKAWETSALHTSVMHDQVSAILVVLPLPAGSPKGTASQLANAKNFALSAGTRHKLTPEISLEQILPDASDQNIFEDNAIRHVAHILSEEIAGLSVHHKEFGKFFDPHALPITKTEEYYLPTYDQEQASTRGNMLVMEHYFRDVLQIPKETFQARNFFLLGDRSGLLKINVQNIGKNAWGGAGQDSVSLSKLLEKLSSHANINLKKIDFYAWL